MKTTLTLTGLSLAATLVATVALFQNAEGRKETRELKASLVAALNRPPPPEPPAPPEPPVEVADVMTKLQRHANKLYFAAKHENWKLAEFYVEEIEETAKDFAKMNVLHGQVNISGLMDALIQPEIIELERATAARNGPDFQQHYKAMINNCNACHTWVKLPWIVIQEPRTPAYDNQTFEVVIAPSTTNAAPATAFIEQPKPQ